MHAQVIEWLLMTSQDFITFKRETFHRAVSYFEAYMSNMADITWGYIQLVAVTALYLAHKIEEPFQYKLKYFLKSSGNAYTTD